MRKSFILHIDSLSILAKMPDDMAGKFIKLIYHFQVTGELLEMDFALEMAITPFINQFERDNNSYIKTCDTNRINGLNGGRPKKQTEPKESEKTHSVILKAKKPYNDSDSKNDSKSKNENESKKESILTIVKKESIFKTELENTFDDFLAMRIKIKKPATEKAIELIKKRLNKLSQGDENLAIQILNQSIISNYQDVYEIKQNFTKFSAKPDPKIQQQNAFITAFDNLQNT